MSPLWRDEVGVYLAQRRVCMVRIRRGMRPTVALQENRSEPLAAPGWQGALALLDAQLAQPGWRNARLRLVIADQWVRYVVVPWSDALTSAAERLAHARELLAGVFGASADDWTVSLSDAPPGMHRLASAVPTALIDGARELATRHGMSLASIQPQLIAAFNTWRRFLPAGGTAWFVTVEEGSLAALRLCDQGVDRVHAVRIGPDWGRELRRLQTFGRLASANPTEGHVYVDVPAALQGLRPASSADLEWLEEANPPVTTLHQLEHLRRSAA